MPTVLSPSEKCQVRGELRRPVGLVLTNLVLLFHHLLQLLRRINADIRCFIASHLAEVVHANHAVVNNLVRGQY